jgi:CTP synthase
MKNGNGKEFSSKTEFPVVDIMEEQKNLSNLGGPMRLGMYKCNLTPGSKIHEIYQKAQIIERHRHRYEVNDLYLEKFEEKGMRATGINPETNLVETIELQDHPWFIGVQYHPELKSRVLEPHPLFKKFVDAALKFQKNRQLK